jgi:hypothetical protein
MQGSEQGVKELLYGLSDTILFLFTTTFGLAIVGSALVTALSLRVYNAVKTRSLLATGAGGSMKAGEGLAIVLEEGTKIGAWVLTNLPALIAVLVVFTAVVGVGESLQQVDAVIANQRRIAELDTTIRNLERRYKVAEAKVLSQVDGVTTLEFTWFASGNPDKPISKQKISLPGKDIYFDAIVCNFAFSEIENGGARNLALPYRVFSEELAQKDGIPLEIMDARGIPYPYNREEGQLFGIEKLTFDERLAELLAIMSDDEESRKAGIVRSVYGSAVHKVVSTGDRISIWIEQSGGLTIKDAAGF